MLCTLFCILITFCPSRMEYRNLMNFVFPISLSIPLFLFLSITILYYNSVFKCATPRLSVYRTNFGLTEWKLQGLRRGRCNATCTSHSITFVLYAARTSWFISTVPTWHTIGKCTHKSWRYLSISSKWMRIYKKYYSEFACKICLFAYTLYVKLFRVTNSQIKSTEKKSKKFL